MKKIIVFILIFILTGCGCEHNFDNELTKDFSKDAKKCEVVKYTSKKNNLEINATPSDDKKTFTASIKYIGKDFTYSFMDIQFTNAEIKQYNGINFLRFYENDDIYLILFDDVGNIRYETAATDKVLINGNNFTVKEYRIFPNGGYICDQYSDLNALAYFEKTYNMLDMSVVDSKEVLLKDVCK